MKSSLVRNIGFTLVEVMVSTAILGLVMAILIQLTGQTTATWRYTTAKAEQFREARAGFETMTRRISQATLNTYWDYDNLAAPTTYQRYSELRFICGPMQSGAKRLDNSAARPRPTHGIFFQAPFGFAAPARAGDSTWTNFQGLDMAINTCGYYIEVADDSELRPDFLTTKHAPLRIRSRLMEFLQPAGAMAMYQFTSGTPTGNPIAQKNYAGMDWFRNGLNATQANNSQQKTSHVLAENIIALAILPKLSEQDAEDLGLTPANAESALAPDYYYHSGERGAAASYSPASLLAAGLNSKHQLPPVVQVTMVAIDEQSAQRLGVQDAAEDPLQVRTASFLTRAKDLTKDLQGDRERPDPGDSLERRLVNAKVNYRIFTTNVVIRGAKWSKEQTN